MKAFILDDEPSAVKTLTLLLQRYAPTIAIIGHSTNVTQAVTQIPSFKPDILFLDIQMPIMNGFDVLRTLGTVDFDVIFTTAYDQYAIQAIRFSALDYLLKPINAMELRLAVDRSIAKQQTKEANQKLLNNLLHNVNHVNRDFKLAITTTDGTFFLHSPDITRLEAEGSYTRFYLSNRKPLLASKTLKDFEELLTNQGFIRVHKSHLVNRLYVDAVHSDGYAIMRDNSRVEISRRRKKAVGDALKKDFI